MEQALKNPKDRIVEVASRLFYSNGYQNTGINEIIQASCTHKASFYRYFESKEELGRAYLGERSDMLANRLERMAARSQDANHFFRFWQRSIYQTAKVGELHGCPLVNFNAELGVDREKFREDITNTSDRWHGIVEAFLRREQRAGRIDSSIEMATASRRIMLVYQGHLQHYSLYQQADGLLTMAADMAAVISP